MEAVATNKPTPINLAEYTYWNLAGHNAGNVLDHLVQIWGSQVTPVNQNSIPTGGLLPVKGTAYDVTSEKKIGISICKVPGLGYGHNYVLDCGEEKSGLKHAAKLKDSSGFMDRCTWDAVLHSKLCERCCRKRSGCLRKTFRIMLGDTGISECH